MAVLEWPGDIYAAMCDVLAGHDPFTHEQQVGALMGLAAGTSSG